MTNNAERVITTHGRGVVTGRSSDGTITVMLDGGRILAIPADQVAPEDTPAADEFAVGDKFFNIDNELVSIVEVTERTLWFRDTLAFRYPVQRVLLVKLLADGTWKRFIPEAAPKLTANGKVPPVTPAGGAFLLEVYQSEKLGYGPKAAFHSYAAAARALVRSGHLRALGGGRFDLTATGRVWAEVYHIAIYITEVYRTTVAAEYTEATRYAYMGSVDLAHADLLKAIRMLFKVTVKQADRAILAIAHQGLPLAVAVRECRAAH